MTVPSTGLTPMQRLEVLNGADPPPRPGHLSDSQWQQCQHLEHTFPKVFHEPRYLCRSMRMNPAQWVHLNMVDDPYALMHKPYHVDLSHKRKRTD